MSSSSSTVSWAASSRQVVPRLAPVDQGSEIGSIIVPEDLYWVLEGSPPLVGMRDPSDFFPWHELEDSDIRHVVCLTNEPRKIPEPFELVYSRGHFDGFGGGHPIHPAAEERLVHEAADVVIESLRSGIGVAVHCIGGRGRTGTVMGVALVKLGLDAAEVEGFFDRLHKKRGRPGWPETPWQSEVLHRSSKRVT